MHILINLLNFRPGRIGGTETYLRELVAHLPAAARGERITLLTSRDVAGEFDDSPLEVAHVPQTTGQICGLRFLEAAAAGFHARSIENAIEQLEPDVVLFPQQSMFPKRVSRPSVLVVHDLYHLHCPQHLSAAQRWFRKRSYPAAMAAADRLIAVSEFTRKAVVDNFPRTPQSVSVVPHGVRTFAPHEILPPEGISRPYLYYPASTLPHKNHSQLFRTIGRLKAQGRFPYRLILTGARTRHWKQLERLRRDLALEETIIHLGYVPYREVLRLVRGAECVVFPSEFEGFGIPVVEAASLERKVITSRLEVFEEIGVPGNYRIDFGDADAFASALADRSPAKLVRSPITWDQCASATLGVLRETANSIRTLPMLVSDAGTDEPARTIRRAA
jgi:glycosyltransferase involved in cell wall biosynthesis